MCVMYTRVRQTDCCHYCSCVPALSVTVMAPSPHTSHRYSQTAASTGECAVRHSAARSATATGDHPHPEVGETDVSGRDRCEWEGQR
ncbi:hypothetical protein FKM82_029012 [Ascaphus truei]